MTERTRSEKTAKMIDRLFFGRWAWAAAGVVTVAAVVKYAAF